MQKCDRTAWRSHRQECACEQLRKPVYAASGLHEPAIAFHISTTRRNDRLLCAEPKNYASRIVGSAWKPGIIGWQLSQGVADRERQIQTGYCAEEQEDQTTGKGNPGQRLAAAVISEETQIFSRSAVGVRVGTAKVQRYRSTKHQTQAWDHLQESKDRKP